MKINWKNYLPAKPSFLGIKVLPAYPLKELEPWIDWSPFFLTWELKGHYPAILKDPASGAEAQKLFNDAQALLKKIIAQKWLTANAVVGFYPANSVDDDIEIYSDDSRKKILTAVHMLRQQNPKSLDQPNLSLADFIAPKESGRPDYLGGFAVTAGVGIEKHIKAFEKKHDDYNSIMLKALADRLAEAFAECLHERVRKEFWGYAKDEKLDSTAIIKEKYQGIRPAPGYPACPDHTEKRILFDLLNAEKATSIELTESFAMYPAASVSGFYFSHPQAKYFGIGKIARDQVEDYARRKGWDVQTAEKWLSPNLDYET